MKLTVERPRPMQPGARRSDQIAPGKVRTVDVWPRLSLAQQGVGRPQRTEVLVVGRLRRDRHDVDVTAPRLPVSQCVRAHDIEPLDESR